MRVTIPCRLARLEGIRGNYSVLKRCLSADNGRWFKANETGVYRSVHLCVCALARMCVCGEVEGLLEVYRGVYVFVPSLMVINVQF